MVMLAVWFRVDYKINCVVQTQGKISVTVKVIPH